MFFFFFYQHDPGIELENVIYFARKDSNWIEIKLQKIKDFHFLKYPRSAYIASRVCFKLQSLFLFLNTAQLFFSCFSLVLYIMLPVYYFYKYSSFLQLNLDVIVWSPVMSWTLFFSFQFHSILHQIVAGRVSWAHTQRLLLLLGVCSSY